MKRNRYESEGKVLARREVMKAYQRHTGHTSLQGEYWTLCSVQTRNDDSEIMQLCHDGFLVPRQFHGVDQNPEAIEVNKVNHPGAHWHAAQWEQILYRPEFNPSLVYLDSIWQLDGGTKGSLKNPKLVQLAAMTLQACRLPKAVVVVNGILSNCMGREKVSERNLSRYRKTHFSQQVFDFCSALGKDWGVESDRIEYQSTRATRMAMFVFHRRRS